ncbi:hypothetical protein [Streptomyces capoamus]|uniref:aggregation-promoting factor C-terminal-like domain-containing protein n=1 Tax=Streptomyces capoamus TaxID=68183 RepID=UPI0033942C97
MAISVGSVEIDVIPNATGIRQRMQRAVIPAAEEVGSEAGRVMGRFIAAGVAGAVRDGVTLGGQQAQVLAARQGVQTGSSFARGFKARLQAALSNLPEVRLNANSTPAERELHRLRAQMLALRDVRIGIDVSAADAQAAMARIQQRLAYLSTSDANVQVRVDAGAAAAQLAAFQAEVNRLDGRSVDVDTHGAAANFNLLTTAALAFGPAILPVLPVVAAGLGAVAAAGAAAAAGVGAVALVAVPAFKQISGVLQAQKAAQDAAAQSTARGGQAAAQASSKALQLASAQQAVASAERNGARQIAQAQAQVSQARQQAAQVAAQASQRSQQAARAVQDAERSLTDAQKAAKQAQLDLNAARQQATRDLQDMNNQLADSVLSQKQAELDLADAKKQRDAVFKDTKATDQDRARAQLAYEQAVQRLKEQQQATRRLKEDTAAANKAGVDGSKTVKDAQERVAQAQQQVADKTRALKDAQEEQARTAAENAQQIAQAQQRIGEAQANVAQAQVQAAEQAAAAQRQLQQAQMSSAGGADQAAIAQAKYRQELAKLTPAGRDTMNAFLDLKSAFGEWSKSLQPAVMPIFTRALKGLTGLLPVLTPFVLEAADAIKGLQDRLAGAMKSPFWKTFKGDLLKAVKPAIEGFGVAFGNIITGIAGIIDAFLPHMDSISGHLQTITGRFAEWGKGLKGSPTFQKFLDYASEYGPIVADTFGKIAGALISIGQAMLPVSGPLMQLVGGLAQSVGWLVTNVPGLVPVIFGLFLATKLWALWQLVLNGAMTAFQVISSMGPWGWIALAIIGVALAVMTLWKHCAWFRDAIRTAWEVIKGAAQTVIDWFSGPFVRFFTQTIPRTFHTVIDWIKRNWPWILTALTGPIGLAVVGIVKHWDAIKKGFSNAWSWIKTNILYPVRDFFTKKVPGWADTLGGKVTGAFDTMKDGIKTAWDKIKDATKSPINFVIGTVWNDGIVKIWKKVTGWIPGVPELHTLPKLAQGGPLPVRPGIFNRPTAIVGEGRPQHPEYVIPTDPRYRSRALALWQAAGGQLMADGGILGGLKSFGGKIGDIFSSATDFLKDPGKALSNLVGKLTKPLDKIKDTVWGKLALAMPKAMLKGLKSLLSFGGGGGGGGGIGDQGAHGASAKQAQNIARAMLSNYGWGPGQMSPLISLWNGESGWRWNALNASSGAYGIPQSLPASKMASAGADWRTNPATQIRWGLSYIKSRYGSPAGAWSAWQARSPHWYDQGGYMPPGMNLTYNGTGQPEPVLTTAQWNAIHGAAARGVDSPSIGDLSVSVYVGDQQITDIARTEIRTAQGELIQVLNAS